MMIETSMNPMGRTQQPRAKKMRQPALKPNDLFLNLPHFLEQEILERMLKSTSNSTTMICVHQILGHS